MKYSCTQDYGGQRSASEPSSIALHVAFCDSASEWGLRLISLASLAGCETAVALPSQPLQR